MDRGILVRMWLLWCTGSAMAWHHSGAAWDPADMPVPLCVAPLDPPPGWTEAELHDAVRGVAQEYEDLGTPLRFDWRGACTEETPPGIAVEVQFLEQDELHPFDQREVAGTTGACGYDRLESYVVRVGTSNWMPADQSVDDPACEGVHLPTIVRHWFGHAIGLTHTCEDPNCCDPGFCRLDERESVMFWAGKVCEIRLLGPQERDGVQALYGAEPLCDQTVLGDPLDPADLHPIDDPTAAETCGCTSASDGSGTGGAIALGLVWLRRRSAGASRRPSRPTAPAGAR